MRALEALIALRELVQVAAGERPEQDAGRGRHKQREQANEELGVAADAVALHVLAPALRGSQQGLLLGILGSHG